MNKRIISMLLALVISASMCVFGSNAAAAEESGQEPLTDQFPFDADENGEYNFGRLPSQVIDEPMTAEQMREAVRDAATLPSKLDLRDYNGKNYVTPVKDQSPFGTCWAFAASAAAEISYLYENDLGVPAGQPNNNVNFSEKHLAWYAKHKITKDDVKQGIIPASQVGEGVDLSSLEANNKNYALSGGWESTAINYYASGLGPVSESTVIGDDTPFYYSGVNHWRQNGLFDNEESAALRKAYYKEKLRSNISQYIQAGYFRRQREYDNWFENNWTSGIKLSDQYCKASNYAPYDDWTLPTTAEYRAAGAAAVLKEARRMTSPASSVWGSYSFNEAGVAAVKNELAKGHGVTIAFYADSSTPNDEHNDEGWMNTVNWAQYYVGQNTSNHAVTVVGYDDNYPKENFTRRVNGKVVSNSTPPANGAFIIKNSWGAITEEDDEEGNYTLNSLGNKLYHDPNAYAWGYQNTGYFYLSYYDQSIQDTYSFSFYTNEEIEASKLHYDQYDLLDEMDYSYRTTTQGNSGLSKTANVFTVEEDCYLSKISFGSINTDLSVHYDIYLNPTANDPASGELLEKGDLSNDSLSLKRIDLQNEYYLKAGEKYSIVIIQSTGSYSKTYYEVFPYFYYSQSGYTFRTVINSGESYFYQNGSWTDLAQRKSTLIGNHGSNYVVDNYPIKGVNIPVDLHTDILGDVNRDGYVDIVDVTILQRQLANFSVRAFNADAADVNRDKDADIVDATMIQRYLANFTAPDGIDQPIV
jgi:C1A family cysteine protease